MTNVNDILDFAIDREQEAADFYYELAERMDRPWMRDVFAGFAREELGHKAKLERVKAGGRLKASAAKVANLKIAEYTVEVDEEEEFDFGVALVIAMKREKAAFRLYEDLSRSAADPELAETFLALAQEEARHKLRFELEYDDYVFQQN